MHDPDFSFKIATEASEFDQIFRLNYKTFVEEIPQHEPNTPRALIDAFHQENTYIICLDGEKLVGMLAVRDKRPFSLDRKLPELDSYLPTFQHPCEIRLLAIEPAYRKTALFFSLIQEAVTYCLQRHYDIALISGTTRQMRLYQHLGFVPFGPLVGTAEARFQPMYTTAETFKGPVR